MKRLITILGFLSFVCGFSSCSSEDVDSDQYNLDSSVVTGKVEFFIIKSFTKFENSCLIDESKIVLSSEPLLNYSDIINYNASTFTFRITKQASLKLKPLQNSPVSGVPFALMVNSSLLYTGYFWPAYSNYACDGILVDPAYAESKQLVEMKLSSPSPSSIDFVDKRNAPALIQTLKNDKKLVE
jgi:hypothetical protein